MAVHDYKLKQMRKSLFKVMSTTDPNNKVLMDVVAWFMNVTTSVLIVFVNKILMDTNYGYKFSFACTLCALHFLTSGVFVKGMEAFGYSKKATLPLKDKLVFSVVASLSITSLNLSLLLNSVGLYQVSKLLIIPFVCFLEFLWYKQTLSPAALTSIAIVIFGVGLVTVSDVAGGLLGMIMAAVSVVTSGLQQVLCGKIQRQYALTSNQLLSNTSPIQGFMLLIVGPPVDRLISGRSVLSADYSSAMLICLGTSCAIAVLVNISQFMCLGRFSAVTFQVLGHTKTVLVLTLGWLYLGESMTSRKATGMVLAVIGMVAYGNLPKPSAPIRNLKSSEGSPLTSAVSSGATASLALDLSGRVDDYKDPLLPVSHSKGVLGINHGAMGGELNGGLSISKI
uniref:Sugar phosphate transporter domain-containing protein n=1 Tax=Polytomella parva TaxID=51329 RepID=A0A7S0UWP6_9CHLO|mmetsp:Transcript_20959/g.37455  ORF Transcript_20959/g.37455 Transcript_20959/m.37455 type:complete len:395 (+) Transcript_20959:59-1243(+)